jgi:hypothetical protein
LSPHAWTRRTARGDEAPLGSSTSFDVRSGWRSPGFAGHARDGPRLCSSPARSRTER